MTRSELLEIIRRNTKSVFEQNTIMTAVDAYSSASNNGKPLVSGSLPCPLCNGSGKYINSIDVAKYYEDDGNDH